MSTARRWHLALRANRDHLLGLGLFLAAGLFGFAAVAGFVLVVAAGVAALIGGW